MLPRPDHTCPAAAGAERRGPAKGARAAAWIAALVREPLVHFLPAGAVVLGGYAWLIVYAFITVSAAKRLEFSRATGKRVRNRVALRQNRVDKTIKSIGWL
ncbi:hypothetical protein FOHLNKBM_4659 [Methylobacterium longum]|nr:hypothetical protein FOHLNKBM_4659 [Methylobacterium longum]